MPRSKLSNWASRKRLQYIADHLSQHGWINREALSTYFGLERSLGSMDLAAYQQAGNPLRKAKAGETMKDCTVTVGYKLGGKLLYVADGPQAIAPDLTRKWDLLPRPQGGMQDWQDRCVLAYLADGHSVKDAAAYFGIGTGAIGSVVLGYSPVAADADRAGVWEAFR